MKPRENFHMNLADKIFNRSLPIDIQNKILGLIPSKEAVQEYFIQAIKKKDLSHAQKLIFYFGAEINKKEDDNIPLHLATESGNTKMVELLLKNKADIHIKNSVGVTALHCAAHIGCAPMIKLLLDEGAIKNIKTNFKDNVITDPINFCPLSLTLLSYEKASKKRSTLSLYYKNEVKPMRQLNNFRHSAMLLLPESLNAIDGYFSLSLAAKLGHLPLIITLLEKKVTPNLGNDIIQEFNLKRTEHSRPLRYAVKYRHYKVVSLLLQNSADPNALDRDGKIALHLANNTKTAKLLLRYKSNVNATDELGNTPLYAAVKKQNVSLVNCLLKNKAQIMVNTEVETPIDLATRLNNSDILKLLLGEKKTAISSQEGRMDIPVDLNQNGISLPYIEECKETKLHMLSKTPSTNPGFFSRNKMALIAGAGLALGLIKTLSR